MGAAHGAARRARSPGDRVRSSRLRALRPAARAPRAQRLCAVDPGGGERAWGRAVCGGRPPHRWIRRVDHGSGAPGAGQPARRLRCRARVGPTRRRPRDRGACALRRDRRRGGTGRKRYWSFVSSDLSRSASRHGPSRRSCSPAQSGSTATTPSAGPTTGRCSSRSGVRCSRSAAAATRCSTSRRKPPGARRGSPSSTAATSGSSSPTSSRTTWRADRRLPCAGAAVRSRCATVRAAYAVAVDNGGEQHHRFSIAVTPREVRDPGLTSTLALARAADEAGFAFVTTGDSSLESFAALGAIATQRRAPRSSQRSPPGRGRR